MYLNFPTDRSIRSLPIQYLPSHLKNLVSNCSYCPHILFRKREQSNWMRLESASFPPPTRNRWLQFTAESHWQWNGGISFRVNRSENLLRWEGRRKGARVQKDRRVRHCDGRKRWRISICPRYKEGNSRAPRFDMCGFPRDKKATFQSWLNAAIIVVCVYVCVLLGLRDDLVSLYTAKHVEIWTTSLLLFFDGRLFF